MTIESYVLDTSALLALRDDEPGADQVESLLRKAQSKKTSLLASFMSFMEVLYTTWRAMDKGAAYRAYLELRMLPILRVEPNEEILLMAAEIKANNNLSLADSWIAATAVTHRGVLVHKDPEFEQLKGKLELLPLPYK